MNGEQCRRQDISLIHTKLLGKPSRYSNITEHHPTACFTVNFNYFKSIQTCLKPYTRLHGEQGRATKAVYFSPDNLVCVCSTALEPEEGYMALWLCCK